MYTTTNILLITFSIFCIYYLYTKNKNTDHFQYIPAPVVSESSAKLTASIAPSSKVFVL